MKIVYFALKNSLEWLLLRRFNIVHIRPWAILCLQRENGVVKLRIYYRDKIEHDYAVVIGALIVTARKEIN